MRIVFIGTGEIGVPALRALQGSEHELVAIVTQPDKPAGREQKLAPPPVKTAMTGSQIPVLQPKRIKDPAAVEQIRALEPEVIVVAAYGQILPQAVLEIPKLACLNLHASLLPRWRGAAPIQAAIAAGDRETGITVMFMDQGLDTGDILLQSTVDISRDETGGSLHDRLARHAPAPLLEGLGLLAGGTAPRIAQDSSQATYAPKLTRQNGRIDWNDSAEVIERKIRAFDPWPGSFTDFGGRNLKVFAVSVVDLRGQPGEVLQSGSELIIAAANQAVSLRELQLAGKRRMSAAEFLRGHAVASASES